MWAIVKGERKLRVLLMLGILSAVLAMGLAFAGRTYSQEEARLKSETQQNLQAYENLRKIASEETIREVEKGLFEMKSFANFEEVIPFIAYLEKLLMPVDPEAQITIKSPEGQIFMDHFADYAIHLKAKPQAKKFFFRAMEEIYKSRFIVKPMSFTLYYSPLEEGEKNELQEALMVLRLYLK